eukprot:2668567-Heterocapsa_arctica.AAC.1
MLLLAFRRAWPPVVAVRQVALAGPDGGMLLLAFWRAVAPRHCYGRMHLLVLKAECSCWTGFSVTPHSYGYTPLIG